VIYTRQEKIFDSCASFAFLFL